MLETIRKLLHYKARTQETKNVGKYFFTFARVQTYRVRNIYRLKIDTSNNSLVDISREKNIDIKNRN